MFIFHLSSLYIFPGPFICETCGKSFRRRYALKKHQVSKHTKANEKPFYCGSCDLGFFLQHHLERHNESKRHKMMVEVGGTTGPLIRLKASDILPQSGFIQRDLLSEADTLTSTKPKRVPIKKARGNMTAAIGSLFNANDLALTCPANQQLAQNLKKAPSKKVANRTARALVSNQTKTSANQENTNKKRAKPRKQNSMPVVDELDSDPFSEEESEEEEEDSEPSESEESDSDESESEIAEARRKLIAAALMRSKGNAAVTQSPLTADSFSNDSIKPRKASCKRANARKQSHLTSSNPGLLNSGFNPGEVQVIEFPPGMTLNGAGHLVPAQDIHLKQEPISIGAEVTLACSPPMHIHEEVVEEDPGVVIDGSVLHSNSGSILTDDDEAIGHPMLGKRDQLSSTSLVHAVTTVTFTTPTLNSSVPSQLLLAASSAGSKNHSHLDDDFNTFVEYYADPDHQESLSDSLRSPDHHL